MKRLLTLTLFIVGWSVAFDAQNKPDSSLLEEITAIKAIDVHAHSLPAGEGLSEGESIEPYLNSLTSSDPALVRLATNHHDYVLAWRAMYDYRLDDMQRDHVLQILDTKKRLIREKGNNYPGWVLDQAGIDTQLIFTRMNGPDYKLGAGQTAPRFLWVPQAQMLVSPLANDKPGFKHVLAQLKLTSLPLTLNAYATALIKPTLLRWKQEGAVGLKFGLAYARPLSFAVVSEVKAKAIYDRHARFGRRPSLADEMALQDYLFRLIAHEAGRVGLIVFIHTGIGADDWFNVSGSNPALLEPVFNDPSMRQTKFVIVHGGWPYDKEAGLMLQKPNVYVDFSVQSLLRSTRAVSATLRAWLEWAPEKVMFGTDAYSEPETPLGNWEEKTWVATRSAREALALALTEMIDDGEITREQAMLLARMVLRENALRLLGLKDK